MSVSSTGDAGVAARDRALPGLAVLLDDDAFAALLDAQVPRAGVLAVRSTYLRYKPGTNCLARYRVTLTGEDDGVRDIELYARAEPLHELEKLAKVERRAPAPSPLGTSGLLAGELGVAIYPFPNDRRIPALARLADAAERPTVLAKALPRLPGLADARLRPLRWKPERRFVTAVESHGCRAVLKGYADGDRRASANALAFRSRGPLRIARPLGWARRHRLLALEWLPGRALDTAVSAGEVSSGTMQDVGAALAALHQQGSEALSELDPELEPRRLLAAAAGVAAVCPGLGARAEALARRLSQPSGAERAATSAVSGAVHGDFSPDQVLVGPGQVGIVDLDQAARGEQGSDLGSFVAALERDVLAGFLDRRRADAFERELLEGYATASGRRSPVAGRHVAGALLRLAPEPFRLRDPNWPTLIEGLLDRAEERSTLERHAAR